LKMSRLGRTRSASLAHTFAVLRAVAIKPPANAAAVFHLLSIITLWFGEIY